MDFELLSKKRDEKAFKKYARTKYDDDPLPDHEVFECWDVLPSDLTVRGFNEDANAALRAAHSGDDPAAELDVPWCELDRISYIMRRVEEKIRIPKAYWFLAANGRALRSDGLACNHLAFQSSSPELVLVPKTATEAFKQAAPPRLEDPIQISRTLFALLEPLGSDDAEAWAAYLKQRKDDTSKFQVLVADLDENDEGDSYIDRAMLEQIRGGIGNILCGTGLSDDQVSSAEKAVLPQNVDAQDDGDGELRSADITTRIYSLHQPSAVDVHITYWNKAGYYSVEWTIEVTYCIRETLPSKDAEMVTLVSCDLENTDQSGRIQRWNPREAKTFGMDLSDVQEVQRLLFGDTTSVSLVDTVRLMLASVGIYVERQAGENGEELDKFSWFQTTTQFSLFDAHWLGVQIRRACSVAIPSDADYVDRGAEPRYEVEDLGSESDEEGMYDDDDVWY